MLAEKHDHDDSLECFSFSSVLAQVKGSSKEGKELSSRVAQLVGMKQHLDKHVAANNFEGALQVADQMVAAGASRESLALEKCRLFFRMGEQRFFFWLFAMIV